MKTLLLSLLLSLSFAVSAAVAADQPTACGVRGQWLTYQSGGTVPTDPVALFNRLARAQVILLGEIHDCPEDHRWQLHTLAQLHARRPEHTVLALEMLPRRLQPVLDRWVNGALTEAEFLKQAEWDKVWDFDPRLYLPLFHYARMNRVPILALNVEWSLVKAVGAKGWDGVPESLREGISRPAQASPEYVEDLRYEFDLHLKKDRKDAAAFARFVEAQTVWDRSMAEVIARHLEKHPEALVVGIMGRGHVRFGHGVAHQLADLGVKQVAGMMTWDGGDGCEGISPNLAHAFYVVDRPSIASPVRLGVSLFQTDLEEVSVFHVEPHGLAEQGGLRENDVILEVAGHPAHNLVDIRTAVLRQAPGTWLPLKVRREEAIMEVVIRFPPD